MNKTKNGQHKRSERRRNGANGWHRNGATPRNRGANHSGGIDSKRLRHIGNFKLSEKSTRETDRKFREMIDALPAAVYTTDANGRLTHFNQACVELSGRVPELGTDRWCVSWKLFYPDGRRMPHGQCPMAIALKRAA